MKRSDQNCNRYARSLPRHVQDSTQTQTHNSHLNLMFWINNHVVVENTQQAPVTAEVTGHPRRKTAPVPGPDSNLPFRVGLAHPGRGKASDRHTQTDRLLSTVCSLYYSLPFGRRGKTVPLLPANNLEFQFVAFCLACFCSGCGCGTHRPELR